MKTINSDKSTTTLDLGSLWATLLKHQVDLSLPLEIPFFFNHAAWCQADSVIDLGTGTGEHLLSIREYFPNKIYTGIDISAEHIRVANERLSGEQKAADLPVEFMIGDAYSPPTRQRFDVAMARLLVQHLKDLDRFLESLSKLLAPGGVLIIIESNDNARRFVPELPLLRRLFDELKIAQKQIDGERNAGEIIKGKASSFGFQVDQDQQITIPSSIASNKKLFLESYRTVFRVVRHHYGLKFSLEALEDELSQWYDQEASYAQIGVAITSYTRIG